jgi:HPt (histidine-containing phosphotransfer) domain-containing protein
LIAARGHNIKGNAASFGFADLGLIAKEMEEGALKKHEQIVFQCILSMEAWLKSSTIP